MKKLLIIIFTVCFGFYLQASNNQETRQLSNRELWETLIQPDTLINLNLEDYVRRYPEQFCQPVRGFSNLLEKVYEDGLSNSAAIISENLPCRYYPKFVCSFIKPIVKRLYRNGRQNVIAIGGRVRNLVRVGINLISVNPQMNLFVS